ncbi:MAG: asparaginase domain-containing protein, partial [Spirochaetaceae bacterium]|nr:asparaginase domain-containing protein [Spirochaetaceae bacterium]
MYKSHISLEVRILLLTGVKTFCDCVPVSPGGPGDAAPEQTHSCPVCREEPGAVPRLNPLAAQKAGLLIRGLGGEILGEAFYERNLNTPKPGGIALSRLSIKLGRNAALDIMFHRRKKRVRITEIRLEEDAGRLIHRNLMAAPEAAGDTADGEYSRGGFTRMDYSRAGMPSLRIRTAADFEIGEETEVFLSDLRRRLQYLELIPGVPPDSVIRCNAYVAIAPYPEEPKNYVKLRNLNSFNFVSKAVNTELSRQEEIIINGGTVVPESRLWNEAKNTTESFQIRSGEEIPRFVTPEGMPPFIPGRETMESLTVELPEARRDRLINDHGLNLLQAEFVCDEKSRADYFEKTLTLGAVPREAAQWMASYVIKEFKRTGFTAQDAPLTPERFSAILGMLENRRIHGSIAKQVISAVLEEDRPPGEIIRERGWEQLTDRGAIETIVKSVIGANPQEVSRIREGDAGPIQFLTGIIMRETGGLAEPTMVKEVLREQLSVSLVYVLSMGGAISGRVGEDGAVESGDERALRELLAKSAGAAGGGIDAAKVRFEPIQVGRLLSEEIVPSDWAVLIAAIADRLGSGTANGIVVAHGTDTLPYTAPLLYWLFADANAPIVLAASSTTP